MFSCVYTAIIYCQYNGWLCYCWLFKQVWKRQRFIFLLPTLRTHEGQQMLEITTQRRRAWLSAISREDVDCLEKVYACSRILYQLASAI